MEEEDLDLSICVAGNTIAPCLQVIADKGYKITNWHMAGDQPPQWDAMKDKRQFSADSAEALLGLIVMWEARGNDWEAGRAELAHYKMLVEESITYDVKGDIVPE